MGTRYRPEKFFGYLWVLALGQIFNVADPCLRYYFSCDRFFLIEAILSELLQLGQILRAGHNILSKQALRTEAEVQPINMFVFEKIIHFYLKRCQKHDYRTMPTIIEKLNVIVVNVPHFRRE